MNTPAEPGAPLRSSDSFVCVVKPAIDCKHGGERVFSSDPESSGSLTTWRFLIRVLKTSYEAVVEKKATPTPGFQLGQRSRAARYRRNGTYGQAECGPVTLPIRQFPHGVPFSPSDLRPGPPSLPSIFIHPKGTPGLFSPPRASLSPPPLPPVPVQFPCSSPPFVFWFPVSSGPRPEGSWLGRWG